MIQVDSFTKEEYLGKTNSANINQHINDHVSKELKSNKTKSDVT